MEGKGDFIWMFGTLRLSDPLVLLTLHTNCNKFMSVDDGNANVLMLTLLLTVAMVANKMESTYAEAHQLSNISKHST